MAKKAKKKASSGGKKVVDLNSFVSTYSIEKVTLYRVVLNRDGEKYALFAYHDKQGAYDNGYAAAKHEREERGLEQGDERVMFPRPVK